MVADRLYAPMTAAGVALHNERHRYGACMDTGAICDLRRAIWAIEAEVRAEQSASQTVEQKAA